MGSIRLPGKSMMDLAGSPLVGRIFERVKRANKIDKIVLATSDQKNDDVLEGLADEYDVSCFRGSEDDLVDRYYQAALAHGAKIVLRLPADCPVIEPQEIDRIVETHLSNDADFSSNIIDFMGNGYPDGIGCEAFDFEVLETVWRETTNSYNREHLATNFYDYMAHKPAEPDRFKIGTVMCPEAFRRPDVVLDVNTPKEYDFMRKLYEYHYHQNPQFHITDVIDWLDNVYRKGQQDG